MRFIGITDGVRRSGIGNSADCIQSFGNTAFHVVTSHDLAVLISHLFYVYALIVGVGIAVV